jgi:phosphomannomutase
VANKSDLIISVSGIRGVVGESLHAADALRFAQALGTYVAGKPVVLSRDSRPSGEMLKAAAAAGLMSVGCPVMDLGIAPTPTVGLAVREFAAAGAIQVSASHNPPPYNGLKLFGPKGMVLTAGEGQALLELHRTGRIDQADWARVGLPLPAPDIVTRHVEKVVAAVDAQAIRSRGFRVLVDANHGAGGPAMLQLLGLLGCAAIGVGCSPDGQFAHEPEPTEDNLRGVAPLVADKRCDLGLALDPDSDRLAMFDETGRYIGEELTLALALEFRLRGAKGPIVVNMSTSRVNEDIAKRHGCVLHRSAVGEANVVEKIQSLSAVMGGEGNGGVIDPRIGWVRDPFIGTALALNLLAEAGTPLSRIVASLPRYAIVKEKIGLEASRLPALYAALTKRWPEAQANRDDGLRLDWPDRWLHVRPSNTEPIVRAIAEAPTEAAARELVREATQAVAVG